MLNSNKIGGKREPVSRAPELPHRPEVRDREWRLARFGPEGLTDLELLCCVLGPGGQVPAAETARAVRGSSLGR